MSTSSRIVATAAVATCFLLRAGTPAVGAEAWPPDSSRILEIYETEADTATRSADGADPSLDFSGYRRADMIGYIYTDQFVLAPATGLDNLRYYAQAVGDLAAQCPNLHLDAAKAEIIPYVLAGSVDLMQRFMNGELTQSEMLQAGWMAMLGLNRQWACTYDPMGGESYDQAQAQCDAAARDSQDLGVLPSIDAAHDITLFLGRYGCDSAEAQRLARQLIAFGRSANTRMHFTERMPSPDSPEGRAYGAVFSNCSRQSLDKAEQEWCGCYVRALHTLNPPRAVLEALAQNPFVDGSTYMTWLVTHLPGGGTLYDCADVFRGTLDWRESAAPRPTACLIGEAAAANGARECRYRAAWGTFTTTGQSCAAEISSRQWGYREVDCAQGGAVAAAPAGPREWQDGIFTMIDYENAVPADFVPPLPDDATAKYPLQVRLLKRETPGLLKSMSLVPMTFSDLMAMRMPMDLMNAASSDLYAIDQEGRLLLVCTYKGSVGQRDLRFWYEAVPEHISAGRLNPALQPYFAQIPGAATTCPAHDPNS